MTGEISDFCPGERMKQSPYSPGLVQDGEWLHREVLHPLHIDKNGKMRASAFPKKDLKDADRGGSVHRGEFISWVQVKVHSDEWAAKQSRVTKQKQTPSGACRAQCADVRAIVIPETSERAFCVLDAALEDNPAHAVIIRSRAALPSGGGGLAKLRAKLAGVFSPPSPIPASA